jgi:hypothetical protein
MRLRSIPERRTTDPLKARKSRREISGRAFARPRGFEDETVLYPCAAFGEPQSVGMAIVCAFRPVRQR